jgi:hypothetical protein
MMKNGRFLLALLLCLSLMLVVAFVVRAKLPAGYDGTKGLYVFWDQPTSGLEPPALPVTGGFWRYNWAELEPTNGGYDWTEMDNRISGEFEHDKLAAVGFSIFNEYRGGGDDRGIQVPAWVRGIDSGAFWPNTRRSPETWYVPNYWNSTFRNYYQRFINAFAQHLVDNPTLRARVAWISLGVGLSGETQPATRDDTPDEPDWYFYHDNMGITSAQWVEYVNWCSNMYKQAFSSRGLSTPLLLDYVPTYIAADERTTTTAYAASIGVGLRHCGLLADHPSGGTYAPMKTYWDTVPTGFETYLGYLTQGRSDMLWAVLCGLSKHPDNFNFDQPLWRTEEYVDLFRFTAAYAGVRTNNTPGAWVGLRETQMGNGETGNYELFMTQKDSAPNGLTVPQWDIGQSRGYRFDVPNGTYQVDLYFAEVVYNAAGVRVFDIKIENVVRDAGFDIWSAAGGKDKPVMRSYSVTVSDGRLDIDLIQQTNDEPTLHAIKVTGPGYLQRVNCGGASYTDSLSNVWHGDREYEGGSFGYIGGWVYTVSNDIIGTTDDYLYQTMRVITTGSPSRGRFCRRTAQESGNTRMRFDIDNNYMYNGNFTGATISVTYLMSGTDRWELRYDSTSGVDKAATPVGSSNAWVPKDNSGLWETAVFYLTDARFADGQPGSTDFSIYCTGDGNEWVSFVEVTKGGGAPSVTPTPTATPVLSALRGTVTLQGRPPPPDASWVVALTVKIGDTNYAAITDPSGAFTITGLTPGTYDVCVKNSHAVSSKKVGVLLVAGMNAVDLGTLREGDANNDDLINISDFVILRAVYSTSDARADFNQNGIVEIGDFVLLRANYSAQGDCSSFASSADGLLSTIRLGE